MDAATVENSESSLTESPCDPAIPLLDIHPEKTLIRKDTRSPVAAVFTTAKTQKQPKCSSTEDWVKKMQCMYTMEYHAAIKRNETTPFATVWMDLGMIRLSEVSQTKTAPCETTYMWNLNRDTNEHLRGTEVDTQG